jgi:dienelactone hydrolase
MFAYFPTNYVWSLTVNIALSTGGHLTEVNRMCKPLLDVSRQGDDDGTERFFRAWCELADKMVDYARRDQKAGHGLSAGAKLARASVYYLAAERMQSRHYPPRAEAFRKGMEAFRSSLELGQETCECVEIPYGSSSYPALFVKAANVAAPAPCMVFCNGLDSLKEMGYRSGIAYELSRRGISTLFIDQPGTGEALRLRGLTGCRDSERWATPAYDCLALRGDVDSSRIGIMGWSLGGYYAPRAAAFEPRFAICVSWGANYQWGELQKRRLAREGDRPVPHYWDHVQWVFGKNSLEEFMTWVPCMNLIGVVERIKVPYLITHGEIDTQIPLEDAYAQYKAAVNNPKAELKIFTADEGGAAHASIDNLSVANSYIADWLHENMPETRINQRRAVGEGR